VRLRPGSWRWLLCGFLAASGAAFTAFSPEASGFKNDVSYTGVAVQVTSAAVVDVRALARARARPEPAGPLEPQERSEQIVPSSRPSSSDLPLSVHASAATVPSPFVSASFLAQTDVPIVGRKTESPPDTNGAVGRDKLMSTLNSNYVIQRKSDGKVLSRVSMTSFWRPLHTRHPFDPRVLYDPYSDRWLVSAANDPLLPSSLILYGISDTSDPQGSWHLYAIDADPANATWADFPTLGFNHSTVAIGVNMFAAGTGAYVRGRLIVLDYASLRAGGDGRPLDISVPGGFALQPAVTYSQSETTLYLVEHVDSFSATYRLWSLQGSTLSVVGGAPRTNPLGPWGTPGPGNFLPQENGRGIDVGDSRVGNAVFRNGHVWYAQTINLPPSPGVGSGLHSAVQWVELETTGAFVQGGRIEDPGATPWNGGHSYAFASIAVNSEDDALVGFSEFESDDFADAAYAYRAGTDAPGTMRAPATLKNGEGPYNKTRGGLNRWGDYSGTYIDPSDDFSLWTIQEYARIPTGRRDGSGRWGAWWGRVGGGPPLAPPQCLVPRVIGDTLATAWKRIARANCRLGNVRRVKSTKERRGRVLRQIPGAGTLRPSDARVRLTVGR
jgi:PASTA domain